MLTIHITLGEQFIRALRCDGDSVSAVAFHQQMRRAPDVDVFGHRTGPGGCRVMTGNGSHPICESRQLGCCSFAPLWPQAVQRADRRSTSLEASAPHLMMSGANATGARWPQAAQITQVHGTGLRRAPSVGIGGRGREGIRLA